MREICQGLMFIFIRPTSYFKNKYTVSKLKWHQIKFIMLVHKNAFVSFSSVSKNIDYFFRIFKSWLFSLFIFKRITWFNLDCDLVDLKEFFNLLKWGTLTCCCDVGFTKYNLLSSITSAIIGFGELFPIWVRIGLVCHTSTAVPSFSSSSFFRLFNVWSRHVNLLGLMPSPKWFVTFSKSDLLLTAPCKCFQLMKE